MISSQEIRKSFLNFFNSKNHDIVSSSSIIVKDDPSLMFTNAGMNQFKNIFLGNSKSKTNRLANSQKCLRVSGKHNDLEEVGVDTYHHTMFEMLGNWSFGDYFKESAISYAWEFLTEILKINKEDLYVTVFEGDRKDGLEKDYDSINFWKKYIDESRILNGTKKDNFWEMGEHGPCGPCSEIHIDLRDEQEKQKISGSLLVNKDHPLVIEIWNLVFIEFNRKANGNLELLPEKHVDTGMGFERLCMVVQNVKSNYDTDIFLKLITTIEKISGLKYKKNSQIDIAFRVIADHVRAVSFSIADGQLPSNNGAGYVIRRILRRAIRYGYSFLDLNKPFIFLLVDELSNQMGEFYPELHNQKDLIKKIIKDEEKAFLKTLKKGLVLLDSLINSSKKNTISGEKVFKLYDTYGFPIDLTKLIVKENNMTIDLEEFDKFMQIQKSKSKDSAEIKLNDWVEIEKNLISEDFKHNQPLQQKIKINRYRSIVDNNSKYYQLVFNKTPFYPQGGGQIGDTGIIKSNTESVDIFDTKKENNLVMHFTKKLPDLQSNEFLAIVNSEARKSSSLNHTATHLLHYALKTILGSHVKQKGSMVNPNHLRFDFSHTSKLSNDELSEVETFVNELIDKSIDLNEQNDVPYKDAIDSGACSLFSEKYGDRVRIITFGHSKELCGGTHANNTSDLWYFKIISESSVASGIRRIEAITGDKVKTYFKSQDKVLHDLNKKLKYPKDFNSSIDVMISENSRLNQEIKKLKKYQIDNYIITLNNEIEQREKLSLLIKNLDLEPSSLKNILFEFGKKNNSFLGVLGTSTKGKTTIMCYVSKDLLSKLNLDASKIIDIITNKYGGNGGGQKFFAVHGGNKPKQLDNILSYVKKYIDYE